MMKNNVSDWPMIPNDAFLFFPSGNQIKEGSGDKQWRKIFQTGDQYDQFEIKNLENLQNKLQQKRIKLSQWFDQPNKLRFLQANKFKIEDTCISLKEASIWRETTFPLKINPSITARLNEGTIYLCGRDKEYRPILAAEIKKMRKYEQQQVRAVLNHLLQYTVDHLLIPGQIQNYVLIVNLDDASMSDIGNTLKKIKVSRKGEHEDMWTHIDKDTVEKKFGGTMKNLDSPFWPASTSILSHCSKQKSNNLITKEQYNQAFKQGKLAKRKIKQSFLQLQVIEAPSKATPLQIQIETQKSKYQSPIQKSSMILQNSDYLPMVERIKKEIIVPIKKREFQLFFNDAKFLRLFNEKK